MLVGYEYVSQVVWFGEYCVCGLLIDLYLMGLLLLYWIDLFDDQVDLICVFDFDMQCSFYLVCDVWLLFGCEFLFDEVVCMVFCSCWCEIFEGDLSCVLIYKDIGNGVLLVGIEYYLLLFFDEMVMLFYYLLQDVYFVFIGDFEVLICCFMVDMKQCYVFFVYDCEWLIFELQWLFLFDEDFFVFVKLFVCVVLFVQLVGGWVIVLFEFIVDCYVDDLFVLLCMFVELLGKCVLLMVELVGCCEMIL